MWYFIGSTGRRMTSYTELVSGRVSEVRAIVVLVVLGPQAWRALRSATIGKGYCIGLFDYGATLGKESHHLAVALSVRLFVKWPADQEKWSWIGMRMPACPRATVIAETSFNSEHGHQRAIECQRAIEVSDSYKDV